MVTIHYSENLHPIPVCGAGWSNVHKSPYRVTRLHKAVTCKNCKRTKLYKYMLKRPRR